MGEVCPYEKSDIRVRIKIITCSLQTRKDCMIMNDRRKTAIILGTLSLFMFIPIAQNVLIGFKIPFFQNLGLTFIFITNGRNIEQRIVAHVLNNLVIEP